ncbi:MAG: glycosyltransferase family 4 protein [Candidatus Bathyarchaeota archaeon]|nr:glycosyltransferase family 4 protein [Candidatus Bathyarchaeota archaeon]
MAIRLIVDSYEAGVGAVGGLSTFHNNLYPRLVERGFKVKTFSMRFSPKLPIREDFKGVIIRRPSTDIDIDVAYAWTYDVLHQYGIDVKYLTPSEIYVVPRYFTNFGVVPSPYRMSQTDLFSPHDWMSLLRSALFAWLHPNLIQAIFIHSTEPGRIGGIQHKNVNGTSEKLNLDDFELMARGDYGKSFYQGLRLIRDLEFPLTFKILDSHPQSALFTVSKIHRKEYLLGLRAHGMRFGKVEDRVFAVYHGVDTKEYRPMSNVEKDPFTIGFIGRCTPVKGIDIIPKLASILVKKIPDVKFHVVTKTETQNPYYLSLMDTICDAGLKKVIFVDNTFYIGEEKIKNINSWSLGLVPSRYEPQGQVDLEFMSCGVVPAVGMGGLREKIVDGFNGIWIDPGDPDETAEKIVQFYKGEYKGRTSEEIVQNCRESAEKIWDWEKRADAHKELYTYLVDGRVDDVAKDLNQLLLPTATET